MDGIMVYPTRIDIDYSFCCKYNKNINCMEKNECYRCGWNPKVEEKRKMKIRERRKK